MILGDDYENQHAIHRAAYVALDGCRRIVSYLVNNTNADINRKNMYEKTPLLIAVDDWTVKSSQDSDRTYLMAKLLLELGADPNIKDHKDWSPLMAAAYRTKVYPNLDLLKLLLEYGADPEAATEDYPTSTYRAKLKSSIKCYMH